MHRHGHDIADIDPELLRDLMRRLLAEQPRFRCRQCGFSGQTWHWQCPSCREWETTRPVVGVLGE
jgi:lipopolysaccharide biosynthesis regulator YciM